MRSNVEEDMSEKQKISRRQFLKTAGITAGALVVACGGLGAAATIPPSVDFFEKQSEGNGKMKKVLVAYSSKAGSTSEVAKAIGEVLSKNGADVTVEQIKNVKDLTGYQAVVVGSLIRMGRWVPEAKNFIEKNKAALDNVPTAIFTACDTMKEDTEEKRAVVSGYIEPVLQLIKPVENGLFAGKMDTNKLSFLDRTIINMMAKGEDPNADYRDWTKINAWAEKLPALML
jgi:menaquinone-dependent protoporphyrinogen oxidase